MNLASSRSLSSPDTTNAIHNSTCNSYQAISLGLPVVTAVYLYGQKFAHSMLALAWAARTSSEKIYCQKHSELTLKSFPSAVHMAGAVRCSRAIILSVCPFSMSVFVFRVHVHFLFYHTPMSRVHVSFEHDMITHTSDKITVHVLSSLTTFLSYIL